MDTQWTVQPECVFSLEVNAVKNPNNLFNSMAGTVFPEWRFALGILLPHWVFKLLNMAVINPKAAKFFVELAKESIDKKKKSGEFGDDVVGFILRVASDGQLSDNEIAHTMIQFFVDGYETVGAQITLAMHYLAVNPNVQEKLRNEILSRKVDHISELDDLPYLDRTVSEVFRIGAIYHTYRTCTKPWNIPNTNAIVEPGMRVMIPIIGLHIDPNHFEEPEKFNPDRFLDQSWTEAHSKGILIPFGMGARQCMGTKITRMETKIFIYHAVKNFLIEPSETTRDPVKFASEGFCRIDGGCHLKITPFS